MTVFVVGSIEPFTEIAMDSTDYPDYGEFRSFAMAGLLAVIVGLSDSSLILGLLKACFDEYKIPKTLQVT